MIAEDDRAVRQSLERTLRLEGFDVSGVRTGLEAVDTSADDLPDLVILDVMMPDIDGLSAGKTLRSRDPELPILMLTARHAVGDRVAGLERGPTTTSSSRTPARSSSRRAGPVAPGAACRGRRSCCDALISSSTRRPGWAGRGDRQLTLRSARRGAADGGGHERGGQLCGSRAVRR